MASKHVIAVSGGVDSVVLLDMAVKGSILTGEQLVVAHFDHGIRPDSAGDEQFVKGLAAEYALPYESRREELGSAASEELARNRRYLFLRSVAKKHDARIVTAHHADDVVETIAINLIRGTGWRGLGVLDSQDILRPLLGMRKAKLLEYAVTHELRWHEDSTNADSRYLRNDIRRRLQGIDGDTVEILGRYRDRQVFIKRHIEQAAVHVTGSGPRYSRYLFISAPHDVGRELLRSVLVGATGFGATRPQLDRALIAIKTFLPGKRCEINDTAVISFTKTEFTIEQ